MSQEEGEKGLGEGSMEGERQGGRDAWRKGSMEGGMGAWREGGMEGGREAWREGGRGAWRGMEGGLPIRPYSISSSPFLALSLQSMPFAPASSF